MARTRYKVQHEGEVRKGLRAEFREGLAYIRKDTLVATIILMSALIGFFEFPVLQQTPALARDVLKRSSQYVQATYMQHKGQVR